MKLIFIWGPAASGKLTVARELEKLTGLPVFHNHLVVDALLEKLPFGDPEFVRLLTFENLAGAPFLRSSEQVSRLNRRALTDLDTVIARGQQDGSIRRDVHAIDVYINIVGLCHYHMAHHAGYLAGGFVDADQRHIQSQDFHRQRQRAIEESCWRYAKADA